VMTLSAKSKHGSGNARWGIGPGRQPSSSKFGGRLRGALGITAKDYTGRFARG